VTLGLGALALVWAGPMGEALSGGAAVEPVSRTSYVVRSGDTIWAIARRAAPGHDPRAVVDAILESNGLDAGDLVPGQMLVVPTAG
jgi:nucleoid-associated protein YgaU